MLSPLSVTDSVFVANKASDACKLLQSCDSVVRFIPSMTFFIDFIELIFPLNNLLTSTNTLFLNVAAFISWAAGEFISRKHGQATSKCYSSRCQLDYQ